MTSTQSSKPDVSIDARGPRFSASLTVIVLAIALVTSNVWVIAFQAAVFAIGAIRGPQFTPYAFIFKKVVKSRLKSSPTFEDVRPPRFAQAVGLGFAVVALIGSVTGSSVLFSVAVSFALAAAFLNAAFNYCLGCQMYLLLVRATTK
jgi:hypothetical protein